MKAIGTICLLSLALLAVPIPVADADPVHFDGTCLWAPHHEMKVGPVFFSGSSPLVCLIP